MAPSRFAMSTCGIFDLPASTLQQHENLLRALLPLDEEGGAKRKKPLPRHRATAPAVQSPLRSQSGAS